MSRPPWLSPNHDRRWGPLATAALDGELDARESSVFAAHVVACAACQARLAAFRRNDDSLRRRLRTVPAVSPAPVLELPAGRRRPARSPFLAGRVGLAASVLVLLVVGGASSASVRAGLGGAVQYAQEMVAPDTTITYAGERGLFRASQSDVIAAGLRRYDLLRISPDGGPSVRIATGPLTRGPLFALSDQQVAFDQSETREPAWMLADADGSGTRPLPVPAGLQVVDVTPGGERLLLRRPDGMGGFLTDAGDTIVVNAAGDVIWQAPGGADIYSLSPDGAFALSGTATGIDRISLADGQHTLIPTDTHAARRPQSSRDGTHVVSLVERIGVGVIPDLALVYAEVTPTYRILFMEPVSASQPPVFRLSPDGKRLALQSGAAEAEAASGSTTLRVWNLDRGQAEDVSALRGARFRDLRWAADSRRLLVLDTRGGRGEAWLRRDDGTLTRILPETDVTAGAWLPDGSSLAVLSDGGRPSGLVAIDSDGRGGAPAVLLSDASVRPRFARDGKAVALVRDAAAPTILSRRGAVPRQIPRDIEDFAWAPDGKRAAVAVAGAVYLWSEHGGLAVSPFAAGTAVSWSPEGSRILVAGRNGAALYSVDGRLQQTLLHEPGDGELTWSPDGLRLAGLRRHAAAYDLVLRDLRTGEALTLLQGIAGTSLTWSPDGRWLAFVSLDDPAVERKLSVVQVDGGKLNRLRSVAGSDHAFAWASDSRTLLYISTDAHLVRAVAPDGSEEPWAAVVYASRLFAGPR